MPDRPAKLCTAFQASRRIASGPLAEVALVLKAAAETANGDTVFLVFEDATGRVVDIDLRGTAEDVVARLTERANEPGGEAPPPDPAGEAKPGRGRPRLGVVAREVTLLPRHWDWLAEQPGGASQALRRLVEDARRSDGGRTRQRAAQAAAYAFMAAMAGNLKGFEEAARALFAGDPALFSEHASSWPTDTRAYAEQLWSGGDDASASGNPNAPLSIPFRPTRAGFND